MLEQIRKEPCKKVTTYATGTQTPNGHLVELFKDGEKTTAYLTVTAPGAFKGYHLHTLRESRYVCLRGTVKITVVDGTKKIEHLLRADEPERLFLPTNVFIGIENIGTDEAWLVNVPHPPYDPTLADEQVDKSPADIERQLKGI
jgi:dTDP-4-dehydrorhamnose 3,5-epimerase-like enzyme